MNVQEFKVEKTESAFVLKDKDGKELEPSAIEPISDKYFLVADDKGGDLYTVGATDGKVTSTVKIRDFKKPKWEAMAFDGEYFYIIGSHAVKLDDSVDELIEKLAERSHLLRFKLKNINGDASKVEVDSIIELNVSDSLKEAGLYDEDPFKNKVKIEGLAVRNGAGKNKELVFALREPHDVMHVFSAELPKESKTGDRLSLNPFLSFEAGKIGTIPFRLSSIEYVPQWNGFFILTSTEDTETNSFFGNALWFISDEAVKNSLPSRQTVPQIVWLFAVDMKAEGLCILPGATSEKLRLALVFDNDFKDTNKAGTMQLLTISKK